MDGERFDGWTRKLIASGSRRGALRLLAGGALGVVVGRSSAGFPWDAAAACGRVGDPCGLGVACCAGAACKQGACACKANLSDCGGRCRNLRTDENNCGKCGRVCAAGRTCCAGRCVNTAVDEAHCGRCGLICPAGASCRDGNCACPPGEWVCDGVCIPEGTCCIDEDCAFMNGERCCNGACVDAWFDRDNCGACGVACNGAEVCEEGHCRECPPGWHGCGYACVDAGTDPDNCGGCDVVCPAGQACQAGACTTTCPPGQTICNRTCVDLKTSVTHCGLCGRACPSGWICCGGNCFDPATNGFHCGACGNACGSGFACVNGTCAPRVCPPGEDFCASGGLSCNGVPGCTCGTTVSGATRCGKGIVGIGCGCTSDAECEAAHGPGAFCAKHRGPHCTCPADNPNRCKLPC